MSQGFQFGRADGNQELLNGTATTGETTVAVQTTLVAATTKLTSGLNRVIPITGSTAVRLPKDQPVGAPIVVANYAATAVTLLVFPPWDEVTAAAAGGKINNGSANASFSVAQNKVAVFYPMANGVDYIAVLSA
jgi:hypothetical protein